MSKNDDSGVWVIIIVVLGVGYGVYTVLKGWADAMGLDVHSVICLVFGVVCSVIAAVLASHLNWRKAVVYPWLLPFFGLFCLPALDYWATPQVGPFGRSEYGVEIAWYGNGWWQCAIILALCGIAFGVKKWLDDGYR